jgi:hypothetical protein
MTAKKHFFDGIPEFAYQHEDRVAELNEVLLDEDAPLYKQSAARNELQQHKEESEFLEKENVDDRAALAVECYRFYEHDD